MPNESPFPFPKTGPKASANLPFYLFGNDRRCVVRCRTRWVSDNCVYVVAPLGTATAVRQHWRASAFVPTDQGHRTPHEDVSVELVSAESLLGADSGMEGLLLRIAGRKEQPATPTAQPAAKAARLGWAPRATAGI